MIKIKIYLNSKSDFKIQKCFKQSNKFLTINILNLLITITGLALNLILLIKFCKKIKKNIIYQKMRI